MGDVPNSPGMSGHGRQDLDPSSSQFLQGPTPNSQPQQTTITIPQTTAPQAMSFNMTSLGAALPNPPYAQQSFVQQHPHSQQQFHSAVPSVYQSQFGALQVMNQSVMNQSANPGYNVQFQQYQYQPSMQQASYQAMQQPQNHHYFQNSGFIPHQQTQQAPQFFGYPQTQYAQQQGQAYQIHQQYDRSAMPHSAAAHSARGSEHLNIATSASPATRSSSSGTPGPTSPSVPRGPPRKPKQSGNALWVGNLPAGANVIDLKDHFSLDATDDIESVFLISKSNCAFVNYKTEASCAAAMKRFHESRFQGTKLVCRLRRQSSPAAVPGVPTGPAALTSTQPALASTPAAGSSTPSQTETNMPAAKVNSEGIEASNAKDKFFIVKSLTMEDLEMSVRNSIWATQSHNEEALNKAFETADNVYLIFSANKSGEYFGYARMASAINDDPAAAIEFAPKAQTIDDPDLPKAIVTPATEHAPKGRIIDDSARGTIFWEAEVPESEDVEVEEEEISPEDAKAWGKPFKLEWISTNRLPFYRTRGLRNPWNSNREVKIARDGTELETSVGRRLISMFQRDDSPVPMMQQGGVVGIGMHPMLTGSGYPQVRFQ